MTDFVINILLSKQINTISYYDNAADLNPGDNLQRYQDEFETRTM